MSDLRTTYRRADGHRIWNIDEQTYFSRAERKMDMSSIVEYETGKPFDVIEEQWDGGTLVRFRIVRLGTDEPCIMCHGVGRAWAGIDCGRCDNKCIEPRVDPPWTEKVESGDTK